MSVFKFKQFNVAQDRCAQKIGTDGVLLGAWSNPQEKPYSILDIGAGTGVISLMMAQRFYDAQVDAVELDEDAHSQATENFENSPWGDRMFCYHASFQEYYEEVKERYDLIISNPPFYDGSGLKDDAQVHSKRRQARFDDLLPFESLVYGVYQLLESHGTFCCVIPYDREERFLAIAAHFKLFPRRITHVKGTENSTIKRSLLQFMFNFEATEIPSLQTVTSELVIENERHNYKDDYIALVKDFYLNM